MNPTSPNLHRVRVRVLARQARHLPWLGLVAALLSACGGGGGDAGDPNFGTPTVTAVTADRVSYGQVSTFTVTGTHLTTSTDFSVTGCDNLAVLRDSTTQHRVTCTPDEAMSVRFTAKTGGSTLFDQAYTVPKPRVTMTTSMGTLVVELEPATVPITVANFLGYVQSGFYNGTIFHRVITVPLTGIAVDQGGGFTGASGTTLVAKTGVGEPITLETNKGLSNLRGSIAMARQTAANTATSQFFFNVVDNTALDYSSAASPGYAVFGNVVSGLTVLDAMNAVSTHTVGAYTNVPVTDIVLTTAVQTQ